MLKENMARYINHGIKRRASCTAKARDTYQYWIAKGRCPRCSAHAPLAKGKKSCNNCIQRDKERQKIIRAYWNEQGRCRYCKDHAPLKEDYLVCEVCRKIRKKHQN